MEKNHSLKEDFDAELKAISKNKILDPVYRRQKLFFWIFRALLTLTLYLFFWEYNWVKWTLILTIPLLLISLFTITVLPVLLKRKVEKTRCRMEETERLMKEILEE